MHGARGIQSRKEVNPLTKAQLIEKIAKDRVGPADWPDEMLVSEELSPGELPPGELSED